MSETRVLTVTGLGAHGDGVAPDPKGATVFVPFGLPGETWACDSDGQYRLTVPHPERQPDLCPHFTRCGGCMAHHMPGAIYDGWKHRLVVSALHQHGLPGDTVAPLVRIPLASRRRAVLTAERRGNRFVIGFHGQRSHRIEELTACAVLRPEIVACLPHLARLASVMLTGHDEGRFVVLSSDTGLDVTLAEPLIACDAATRATIAELARTARFARVSNGSSAIITIGEPQLSCGGTVLSPPPGAFVQASEEAEQQMTDLVRAGIGKAKRVADLFAGIGTFTLPLARGARVVAFDSAPEALDAISAAIRMAKGLKPVETRVRDLFREPLSPKELSEFDAVVFDPPRAGAKAQTERLARTKLARIVAVSCNPTTLARDLAILVAAGFRLKSVTPVDQFVLSAHIEAVAVLDRT